LVAIDDGVGGDQRARLAGEGVAYALNYGAERDDCPHTDRNADEEEQQPLPG
jgi:hypothetical protein